MGIEWHYHVKKAFNTSHRAKKQETAAAVVEQAVVVKQDQNEIQNFKLKNYSGHLELIPKFSVAESLFVGINKIDSCDCVLVQSHGMSNVLFQICVFHSSW